MEAYCISVYIYCTTTHVSNSKILRRKNGIWPHRESTVTTFLLVENKRNFMMVEKIGAVHLIKSYDREGSKYLG